MNDHRLNPLVVEQLSARGVGTYINPDRDHFASYLQLVDLLLAAYSDTAAAAAPGGSVADLALPTLTLELQN